MNGLPQDLAERGFGILELGGQVADLHLNKPCMALHGILLFEVESQGSSARLCAVEDATEPKPQKGFWESLVYNNIVRTVSYTASREGNKVVALIVLFACQPRHMPSCQQD